MKALQTQRYVMPSTKLTLNPNGTHYISGPDFEHEYNFTDIEVFLNSTESMSLSHLVNFYLAHRMEHAQ